MARFQELLPAADTLRLRAAGAAAV